MLLSVPANLLLGSSFTGKMLRCVGSHEPLSGIWLPKGPECRLWPAVLLGGRFSRCDQEEQVMRTQSRGKTLVPPSGLSQLAQEQAHNKCFSEDLRRPTRCWA